MSRHSLYTFRLLWFIALAALSSPQFLLMAEEEAIDPASRLGKRLELRTPVEDELLSMLERDYIELLKTSDNLGVLLDAEELLVGLEERWTNYNDATQLLKRRPDNAAIPLLLRYMVLHAEQGSSHVMIPQYRKTVTLISGHDLPPLYQSGPDLEARMRVKVLDLYNNWWLKEREGLEVDPAKMSQGQLQVVVTRLLEEARDRGDFTGSGGAPDTAYGAYHNVYYKVLGDSSSVPIDYPLHPSMIPLILAPSGYRKMGFPEEAEKPFPFGAMVLLAELCKAGEHATVGRIAEDQQQNGAVRMVCVLALFRAGHPFRTDTVLEVLDTETDLERRMIALLSLRWAGPEAVAVLLEAMEDPNMEIVTAAGCALTDAKPAAAMPQFERALDRHHVTLPLLLLNAMAEYKTPESRALLTKLLTDAMEGRKNGPHLSRILSAFGSGWDIPYSAYRTEQGNDYVAQAKLALAQSQEVIRGWKADLKKVEAAVASLRTQIKVAREIQTLRQAEYKRLLLLQGDLILGPEESQLAHERLKVVKAEIETLDTKLAEREAKLDSLKRQIGETL